MFTFESITHTTQNIFSWDRTIFKIYFSCVGTFNSHFLLWRSMRDSTKFPLNNKSSDFVRFYSSLWINDWSFSKNSENFGYRGKANTILGQYLIRYLLLLYSDFTKFFNQYFKERTGLIFLRHDSYLFHHWKSKFLLHLRSRFFHQHLEQLGF